MPGDYTRVIPIYGMSLVDRDLPTITPILITAKTATRIICIQRITFVPVQYLDGTLQFIDSVTGTIFDKIVLPAVAPSLGRNMFYIDYGPRGTPLTIGANLILGVVSGAVGRLHIEAYQKGR